MGGEEISPPEGPPTADRRPRQANDSSISGSSLSVVEKRTFGALSFCIPHWRELSANRKNLFHGRTSKNS